MSLAPREPDGTESAQRVRIVGLTKTYPGADAPAVEDVSLEIEPGSFFSLLGPSGCGKTTIMRCIAGLEKPDDGEIWINDTLVFSHQRKINVPPHQRRMGMVFQSYAIWPHKTVFGNVAYPLKNLRLSRAEIVRRVDEALSLVGLTEKSKRSATLLSGGEQQRVALARAIVGRPRLLLLDEPLSNLDAKLRAQMRLELRRLQKSLGITTIYVTHDQEEAFSMSETMAVLHSGSVVELGPPEQVYRTPASLVGAEFLATSARVPGTALRSEGDRVVVATALGELSCRSRVVPAPGTQAWVYVRPDVISVLPPGTSAPIGASVVVAQLRQLSFHGAHYEWSAECGGVVLPGQSVADTDEGRYVRTAVGGEISLAISQAICIAPPPDSGPDAPAPDVTDAAPASSLSA